MDDLSVERVLRWAALERGTAGLSDDFGAELIAPAAPTPGRPAAGPMTPVDQVQMFGVRWRPGDWLLRDQDGIARLDHATAASIAAEIAAGANREVRSLVTGTSAGARSAGGV